MDVSRVLLLFRALLIGAILLVQIVVRKVKRLQQLIGDMGRAVLLDFQSDSIASTPFAQFELDRL